MLFLIVGGTILIILPVLLFFARWCYKKAFYMPKKEKLVDPRVFTLQGDAEAFTQPILDRIEALERAPYERVTIRSHDGLSLAGRFYPIEGSRVVEIFFHGWRGTALRDGCGGGTEALAAGHNLLLIDQRAHGASEGNVITFGIKEKEDCLSWIDYVIGRMGDDVKILLSGISMGAATVLMASELELPPAVKGIVADCGYTSPEAIIRKVCRDMGISDCVGYPVVKLSARLFGHFSMRDAGAVEAVKRARVPILIIHGEGDGFVPFSMAEELAHAAGENCRFVRIPKAEHGLSFFYDYAAYMNAVRAFHASVL